MALLTPMTLGQARDLGARFGLEVTSLRPVPHGSVNSNFELGLAGGGRAFLRLCEESGHAAVRAQNRLLTHLVEAGVPTPAPLPLADGSRETVATHAGKPVAIFSWCEGEWICQRRVAEAHLERVGEVLGAIHRVGEGYEGAPENRFAFGALQRRLEGLRESSTVEETMSGELREACAHLERRIAELAPRIAELPPSTIVHGDVFRDNVLWTDAEPPEVTLSAVLDFESASMGDPAFDLMVTMLAWCYGDRLEQPLARALMRGYRREREPTEGELAACYDQARAGAVRFAVTRITDYELRPRGVVVYKDYRRFLDRLAAVEAIGEDDFVDWLVGARGR